jgi:hypothetical protein
MSEQQQISIQDSLEPTEESKRIITVFDDLEKKQLDFLDESGKSIIERIATFLAVLFAVTAFGNNFPPLYLKGNPPAKVMVIITLILYLAAMGSGIWAIQPRWYKRYQYNVTRLRNELDKITKHKMLWIRIAGLLFALGSVALASLIVFIIWTA